MEDSSHLPICDHMAADSSTSDFNNMTINDTFYTIPPWIPFAPPTHELSFTQASMSDISLSYLEELFARISIDDMYLGPVKDPAGNVIPLHPEIRITAPWLAATTFPSPSTLPPGFLTITQLWPVFVNQRLSYCNRYIQTMNVETLRYCLHDHGLNQLGSVVILRRRLQEFVRRVRSALSSTDDHSNSQSSISHSQSSPLGEELLSCNDKYIASPLTTPCLNIVSSTDRIIKLSKPILLTPDAFYSYLLIIDLEATCDAQDPKAAPSEYPHEIIEFPVLLYNTLSGRCIDVFHAYCKPRFNPHLTSFCTNLTRIDQGQIDTAQPFQDVLIRVQKWLFETHGLSDVRCAVVCDCSADMSKFMRIQCRLDHIALPSWATVWINLSKSFRIFYKVTTQRVTLKTMLQDLGLSFIGRQHRGLDDAINILRVMRTLLADGCLLRVNERLDLGRPPKFVISVPRNVAEAASGLMGSRLPSISHKFETGYRQFGSHDKENKSSTSLSHLPKEQKQFFLCLASMRESRFHTEQQ